MAIYQLFRPILAPLSDLLYPRLCLACQKKLALDDSVLCLRCQYHIKPTDYHLQPSNPVLERFWGRVNIEHACTSFIFTKGSALQALIHELKYNNQQQVGIELGQRCGRLLQQASNYQTIDAIIPVPLHQKKLRERGYNQAALFAQGISEILGKPCVEQCLIRTQYTSTQTKKSRLERLENVESAFAVHKADTLQQQHILLVDDVITTGATLEACAQQLLNIEGVRISIVAIALAN